MMRSTFQLNNLLALKAHMQTIDPDRFDGDEFDFTDVSSGCAIHHMYHDGKLEQPLHEHIEKYVGRPVHRLWIDNPKFAELMYHYYGPNAYVFFRAADYEYPTFMEHLDAFIDSETAPLDLLDDDDE